MSFMRATITLLLLLLGPVAASAATVDQIVKLAKSGVSDTLILALIARDKSIFSIEPEQLVTLQQDLSEPVILAMLKSGRAEAEAAANAEAALTAAWFLATAVPPQVVVVGASEAEKQEEKARNNARVEPQFVPYPVMIPVGVPVLPSRCVATAAAVPQASSSRGIFFSQPTAGIFFTPPAAVDCQPPTRSAPRR